MHCCALCRLPAFKILWSSQSTNGCSSQPHSEAAQSLFGQSAEDLRGRLPGVKAAGISALAALTEVSHPAVVS